MSQIRTLNDYFFLLKIILINILIIRNFQNLFLMKKNSSGEENLFFDFSFCDQF